MIVVTGASGMLGGVVYRQLLAAGKDVDGWSHSTTVAPDGVQFVTGRESADVREAKTVIHCAAMTDADAAEADPSEAYEVNVVWPGRLAARAHRCGARFVYVSTDAVYDGDARGLRSEDDSPNPVSVYARTKLYGEQAVLFHHPEATIVRTTMFGWTLPGRREKFAEQVVRGLLAGDRLTLFGDAFFSPLHVHHLANVLVRLVGIDYPGILNVGAAEPVSKYEFGLMVARRFGLDPSPIESVSVDDVPLAARRTKNTGLNVSRATRLLGIPFPTVEQGVDRLYLDYHDGVVEKLKGGPWP